MTFHPAPPNSVSVFGARIWTGNRKSRPHRERQQTNRSTLWPKEARRFKPSSNVLACFFWIRNRLYAIIELDANEPPIGDGSARDYWQAHRISWTELQPEKREPYRITTPLELQNERGAGFPFFRTSVLRSPAPSSDRNGRFLSFGSVELSQRFGGWILRTPGRSASSRKIEYLIKNGLIKGGSLENAVVIRDDAVLTTEPLRYQDEFVRHKILNHRRPVAGGPGPFAAMWSPLSPAIPPIASWPG